MREFHKKRKLNSVIYSAPTAVLLFIIILFLARASWNSYHTYSNSKASSNNSYLELKSLRDRENYLKERINFLNTDEGVEAEIRSKYKAVKEGEEMTVIVEDDSINNTIRSTSTKP